MEGSSSGARQFWDGASTYEQHDDIYKPGQWEDGNGMGEWDDDKQDSDMHAEQDGEEVDEEMSFVDV
jgi:hypothetical protein